VPNAFGTTLVTMLILLEPMSNIPMFLSLTPREDARARSRIALVAVVAAAWFWPSSPPSAKRFWRI
jgi:small neutral amino acid transporter SnatA (MarC family)